jgi:ammonia channel protein AmtB
VPYSHSINSVLLSAALNVFPLYANLCLPEGGSTKGKHVAVSDWIDGFLLTVVTCVVWVFTGVLKKNMVNNEVL